MSEGGKGIAVGVTGAMHDRQDAAMPLRRGLLPFARRHLGQLLIGLAFTFLLVASRLALPLPLGAVVDHATAGGRPSPLLGWGDPVAVWSSGFVLLALVAGMAEHYQRLAFAHFAGRSVADARSEAVSRVKRQYDDMSGVRMATVIADSARVKQGLKGVLNHITLNALLVIGACVILMGLDTRLGLAQLAGVGVLVVVAVLGAAQVARVAVRFRDGEARVAGSVHDFVSGRRRDGAAGDGHGDVASGGTVSSMDDLRGSDADSGRADTGITAWEGITTAVVHVVLAVSGAAVLLLGVSAAREGAISTGTLFSVMAYLLVLHGPAVRFARQVTRIAPLVVSAKHLGGVLVDAPASRG